VLPVIVSFKPNLSCAVMKILLFAKSSATILAVALEFNPVIVSPTVN